MPLVVLVACTEPPAYRMRWTLAAHGSTGSSVLRAPEQCSEKGVLDIEIALRDSLGLVVERSLFPCFPEAFADPNGSARGGHITQSDVYEVIVRGVQRDGNGWLQEGTTQDVPRCEGNVDVDTDEPTPGTCEMGNLVCACQFAPLKPGKTRSLATMDLVGPPPCRDGIDNDADGLVDDDDPPCRSTGTESGDAAITQLSFTVSFFGENPNVSCGAVNMGRVVVAIDGEVLAETACTTATFLLSAVLGNGAHTLQFTGLGASGQPITSPLTQTFDVMATGIGAALSFALDFSADAFLTPIVAPMSLPIAFADEQGNLRSCNEPGAATLADVTIEVVDASGNALDTPVNLANGTPLGGSEQPCPTATLWTEPVTFGGYGLVVQARSAAGDVCFSSVDAPLPLSPNENPVLRVPAVTPLPASCR